MERKELDVILKLHAEWIRGISTGKRADLSGANLSRANLYRANLSEADLSGADLYRADLSGADLSGADLYRADLSEADLSGANLSRANLYRANLSEADLYRANIYEAKNAELVIAQTRILPAGDLIVWKKCQNGVIVKLRVRTETKRSHAFGRKCRAESVDVLEVYGSDCGVSIHDRKTTYRTGETVTCDKWNEDFTVECGGGIHFFITREEAEAFDL